MAITVTDVVSEFGNYYINEGQNMARLTQRLLRPGITAGFFQLRPTMDNLYRVADAEVSRVLQPFQKQFTPLGDTEFKPHSIPLYKMKVDVEENPHDIADIWLGFLEGQQLDPKEWPFVRFWLEELVANRMQEDFELNEAYAGAYAAPTPGTPGGAGTAMDGIAEVFSTLSARISTINSGVVPDGAEDFVSYVEEFVAGIEKEHRRRIDHVFMNEDLHLKYRQGKRSKYNQNYAQETDLDRVIDFPQCTVVGLPSMGESGKLWATLPQNRVRLVKKADLPMKVEGMKRLVNAYTDYSIALNFLRPESVFVSDQA
jgi:hypothetical protein